MINRLRRTTDSQNFATRPAASVFAAWLALAGTAGFFASSAALGLAFVTITMGLGTLLCVFVLAVFPAHPIHGSFGAANLITLARALLTCLLAATIGQATAGGKLAWALFLTATLILVLDGIDGPVARRRKETSDFGARFDMESDAFFVLVLALMVAESGKSGLWVLASGLLRYLFIAAGFLWPWLRRSLPPSRRRSAVCALQAGLLVACTAPIVPPALAFGLAGVGLGALMLSFVIDIRCLYVRSKVGDPT